MIGGKAPLSGKIDPFHDIASNGPYGKEIPPPREGWMEMQEGLRIRVMELRLHPMRTSFGLIGCGVILLPLSFTAAIAAERSQGATALDACAAYGPGFTSDESSTRCVRIGGHVRVEWTRSYRRYYSGRTDLPAADIAEPRHLRVGADEHYGYDPFLQPASANKTAQ